MTKKLIPVFAFILVILSSFASAFGVSSSYWEGNPLQLAPGDSTTLVLKLQNVGGGEDITLRAEIINGTDIVNITDSSLDYFVPLGEENVPVNLEIKIPKDAQIGKIYKISILFKEITSGEGGTVRVAAGVQKTFDVAITGKSAEQIKEEKAEQIKNISIIIIPIIILIVIIIIIIISIRKNKK